MFLATSSDLHQVTDNMYHSRYMYSIIHFIFDLAIIVFSHYNNNAMDFNLCSDTLPFPSVSAIRGHSLYKISCFVAN